MGLFKLKTAQKKNAVLKAAVRQGGQRRGVLPSLFFATLVTPKS